PERFGEIARRSTEDTNTAVSQGRFGPISAGDLTLWPSAVDALMQLEEGEVSEVVETPWGFHIFRRLPAPAEERLRVRRIVIGYRQAEWLMFHERLDVDASAWRSRERTTALTQAQDIATQLQRDPSGFSGFLGSSDHFDAPRGGYAGVWTTQEPNIYGRALDEVSKLKVGETSAVVDTPLGFTVWQRMPLLEAEPEYAATTLRLRYDMLAPTNDPSSRQS